MVASVPGNGHAFNLVPFTALRQLVLGALILRHVGMSGHVPLLKPLIYTFRWSLQPIAPFTWFGLGISALDVVATARLCLGLRQLRESLYAEHVAKKGAKAATKTKSNLEIEKSFVKDISTTLTVAYGGEAMAGKFFS